MMTNRPCIGFSISVFAVAACGGSTPAVPDQPVAAAISAAAPSTETYAPLGVGSGYASWTKVSTGPFQSPTHGNRFVEIYVNDTGAAAYQSDEDEFPEGSIIVKTSWERDGDQPSDVAGPIFVMEKRKAGYDPEHNDWYYALHWEKVPAPWVDKVGAEQVYWQSPSGKVGYCSGCHDNYPREVGLPPKGARAWESGDGSAAP